jgi:hypothetical protein
MDSSAVSLEMALGLRLKSRKGDVYEATNHQCTEAAAMRKNFWRARIIIQIELRAALAMFIALIYVYLFAAAFLTS